jgi:hypothetical protein
VPAKSLTTLGFILLASACAAPPIGTGPVLPFGASRPVINCDDPQSTPLCAGIDRAQAGGGVVVAVQQGRPAPPSECPEGREIRSKQFYDTRLSDCEVLAMARKSEEAARASQQRSEQTRLAEEKRARDEQQRRIEEDRSLGYAFISSEDFLLDGKKLASTDAKVALQGMYVKTGAVERLFPSPVAAVMATRGSTSATLGVVLLTDDAPRELRAYFLRCGSLPGSSQLGCPVRVRGHATTCERTMPSGQEAVPCLAVEGGRF